MIGPQGSSKGQGLNPANGFIFEAIRLNETCITAHVPVSLLVRLVPDPIKVTDERRDTEGEYAPIRKLRSEIQRAMTGPKKRNVVPYSEYARKTLHDPRHGFLPAIQMFSPDQIFWEPLNENSGLGMVQVPWNSKVLPFDGDTQTAALHRAIREDDRLGDKLVALQIHHNKPITWARQAFHDANTLAVGVVASLAISMDNRDPITRAAREVVEEVAYLKNRVNMQVRQLSASDPSVLTLSQVRNFIATFAKGIAGVQYGTKPVPLDGEVADQLSERAVEVFQALTDACPNEFENRDRYILAAPSVITAVGAVFHPYLSGESTLEDCLATLEGVDWEKGEVWEGIAGKTTTSGRFSVAGAKEASYNVYRALTGKVRDPDTKELAEGGLVDPGYARIRHLTDAATPTAETVSVS